MTYLDEAVQGVFLLILAVAGNFVAETLGCKTQKLLSENMFAKHFVIISILYFAIDFSSGSNNPRPPWDTLKLTLVIYILFILFTKMSLPFSVIVFGMFITGYFINTYIEYYRKTDPKNPIIKKFQRAKQILYIIMIGLIILGFGLYFAQQWKDHSKHWSTTKFIFGVNKCESLQ